MKQEPQEPAEANHTQDSSESISEPDQTVSDPSTATQTTTEQQITELINDLQRTRADFENYRKQADLQKSQAAKLARDLTVEKFLPLVDDFSRAISAYPSELKPLEKNLLKTLQKLGLTIINSAPGVEFNPDLHEAVSVDDGEGDIEVITETLRPGYLYDGGVVRTAMVKVGHTNKPPKKA